MKKNISVKKLQSWYNILLVAGLAGLIDIATRSLVFQKFSLPDMGYIKLAIYYLLEMSLGAKIAFIIEIPISLILSLSILWLAIAYYINQKIKTLKDPSVKNIDDLKKAKVLSMIIVGIVLALVILGIIAAAFL